MKPLTDEEVLELYEHARDMPTRTPELDVMEALAGEITHNRALFGTFGVLTSYCVQHNLTLRCDFSIGPNKTQPSPGWVVRIGRVTGPVETSRAEEFAETAHSNGPVLADCIRALAVGLDLLPPTELERVEIAERASHHLRTGGSHAERPNPASHGAVDSR